MDIHSCRLEKYVAKDDGAATCLVLDREIDEGRLRELVKTLGGSCSIVCVKRKQGDVQVGKQE